MKLKDNALKLRPEEPPDFYARALRVIGQDVTDLFPEKLEIEYQGNLFLTRVQCSRERLERQQPKDGWTSFKELLSRNLSDFTAPNAKPEKYRSAALTTRKISTGSTTSAPVAAPEATNSPIFTASKRPCARWAS
jgi:hypothetical protein